MKTTIERCDGCQGCAVSGCRSGGCDRVTFVVIELFGRVLDCVESLLQRHRGTVFSEVIDCLSESTLSGRLMRVCLWNKNDVWGGVPCLGDWPGDRQANILMHGSVLPPMKYCADRQVNVVFTLVPGKHQDPHKRLFSKTVDRAWVPLFMYRDWRRPDARAGKSITGAVERYVPVECMVDHSLLELLLRLRCF